MLQSPNLNQMVSEPAMSSDLNQMIHEPTQKIRSESNDSLTFSEVLI